MIRSYGEGISTFVETGTGPATTTAALVDCFDSIYTIELDWHFYLSAVCRFANTPKVLPIYGDSVKVLNRLTKVLNRPALYWLDAHFCGGIKGSEETPILGELAEIVFPGPHNVILIDDASMFGADPEPPHTERWPSMDEIRLALPGYRLLVLDDIIRAT